MGTKGLTDDALEHPLTKALRAAGMDDAADASSGMVRPWEDDMSTHRNTSIKTVAVPPPSEPKPCDPPDPKKLDAVVFKDVKRANDGRIICVRYSRVPKDRITLRTHSTGFPLCECTSEYGRPALSESGESVSAVVRRDVMAEFSRPGAWIADEKQGGKDRERWLTELNETVDVFWNGSYADIRGNVETKEWRHIADLTDDDFKYLHQIAWEPSREDIRKLAMQGIVLERQRCDRTMFALVRDGEKAARILVGRKKRSKDCERRRIERLHAAARTGRIPKAALRAGLYAAKCCLTLASIAANRATVDAAGAERLACLLAGPEKVFVECAWAKIKEWQSMRFGKFDEYRRVCAVARRHASDAATKLACKMWAKSGENT